MTLMGRTDHDMFTLTPSGRALFRPAVNVKNPVALLNFRRPNLGTDFEERTATELILHLAENGWRDREHHKSKKVEPYTAKGEKVWYKASGSGGKLSRLYLQALAVAEQRFKQKTIQEVAKFHKCLPLRGRPVLKVRTFPCKQTYTWYPWKCKRDALRCWDKKKEGNCGTKTVSSTLKSHAAQQQCSYKIVLHWRRTLLPYFWA